MMSTSLAAGLYKNVKQKCILDSGVWENSQIFYVLYLQRLISIFSILLYTNFNAKVSIACKYRGACFFACPYGRASGGLDIGPQLCLKTEEERQESKRGKPAPKVAAWHSVKNIVKNGF